MEKTFGMSVSRVRKKIGWQSYKINFVQKYKIALKFLHDAIFLNFVD